MASGSFLCKGRISGGKERSGTVNRFSMGPCIVQGKLLVRQLGDGGGAGVVLPRGGTEGDEPTECIVGRTKCEGEPGVASECGAWLLTPILQQPLAKRFFTEDFIQQP